MKQDFRDRLNHETGREVDTCGQNWEVNHAVSVSVSQVCVRVLQKQNVLCGLGETLMIFCVETPCFPRPNEVRRGNWEQ